MEHNTNFKSLINEWLTVKDNPSRQGRKFEELCIHIIKFHPLARENNNEVKQVLFWKDFIDQERIPINHKDWGTDLGAILSNKKYIGIQCKNYQGQGKIEKEKIDGFINDLNRNDFIHQGWLVYNGELTADALAIIEKENIKKQKENKPIIKLITFDEIIDAIISFFPEVNNLQKIENFWTIIKKEVEPKKARDYQKKAVQKAEEHFLKNKQTRGTLIMACGSGKTFTAFAIIKAITTPPPPTG